VRQGRPTRLGKHEPLCLFLRVLEESGVDARCPCMS